MNIYLVQEGNEFGPYSWVEIYAGLKKGELNYVDQVRIDDDPEIKSIEEFGFWNEGSDVGPLTWEEILFLLREGCLDGPIPAKIEGEADFSTLEKLIAARPGLLESPDSLKSRSRRKWLVPASVAAAVLILALGGLGFYLGIQKKPTSSQPLSSIAVREQEPVEAPAATATPVPVLPESPATPVEKQPVIVVENSPALEMPLPTPAEVLPVPEAEPTLANVQATTHQAPAPATPAKTTPSESAVAKQEIVPEPTPAIAPAKPTPTATPVIQVVANFFKIRSIKFLKKEPRDGIGVWSFEETKKKRQVPDEFQPCLEVSVDVAENTRSDQTMAKAYFFDDNNEIVFTHKSPSKAGKKSDRNHFAMPVLFKKGETDRFFFEVPEQIRSQNWKAVIVFGDKFEAKSIAYPQTVSDFLLSYPEKELVYDRTAKRVARKPAMDPLIEYVVKTKNPRQPQITLFLRPPKDVSSASDVDGVMALCVLAPSVDALKRELQKEEMSGDYNGLLGFANKHKLAIIAWGSRGFWDVGKNYDELAKERAKEIDKNFDIVADAWERGVKELCEKYGLPDRNFLIWGQSGSAQWAKRLCLRKPDYFLAIHIHVPSSFDKPTPEARKVFWCVTTGELEPGYERSKRFVAECQRLGYPIVYKAIPGLGHAGHPDAAALGFKFFEFALSQRKLRAEFDQEEKNRLSLLTRDQPEKIPPWPEIFQNPAFYGDVVNQAMFPASQKDMIPEGFRIPLPNKDIATIWNKDK
ncbi:MAG: hypothetical protein IAE94_06925 [Chthoniobacterales bacterium]|nr:hypothetical protein [Chthoniobacterales bacterium]